MKFLFNIILFFYIGNIYASDLPELARYVNPFVGTANNGNTHPGAISPWGMVAMTPQNVDFNSSGYYASGYVHGGRKFYGFSHTALSGVGCKDMSSILLLPFSNNVSIENLNKGLDYSYEFAEVGYYRNVIMPDSIIAEVTSTIRSGMARFTYSNNGTQKVFLNLGRSLSKNKSSIVRIVNDSILEGYKLDGSFGNRAAEHRTYFSMVFNKRARIIRISENYKLKSMYERRAAGDNQGVYLEFEESDKPLLVKTGISYVSVENARLNRETENPGWNFDIVRKAVYNEWNKILSRIRVKCESDSDMIKFYTGIYHTLIHPNIISDVNGDYPLMGERQGIGNNKNRSRFSVFSLWDTYRTVHPFLTLVYPEIQSQMLSSMVDMYKENGWLPKWEIVSNESFTMVGDPAIPVIVDSYMKGIRDFDYCTAYEAMLKHGNDTIDNVIRPGLASYIKYGYIPEDDKGNSRVWGSLSTSLEYNFSDWTISQMALSLKDTLNYNKFFERSKGYKNYWNAENYFLHPKMRDGTFMKKFDPLDCDAELGWNSSGGKGYVEGNAWQYTWFVPHDINGLINLFGKKKSFIDRLQQCFDENYFVLSNEPDMAYPYLFNYLDGEEWRTQKIVKDCINNHYSISPSGLPGNDDTGTLSAWLVWSMMGIYPDCPGKTSYAVVTPSFEEVEIILNKNYYKGDKIIIRKEKSDNYKIKSFNVNNVKQKDFFIEHDKLVEGSIIDINLK